MSASGRWPRVPLGEVAPLVRRPVAVDPDAAYREIGIRSFGKGVFHKPEVSGVELGDKRVFSVEPDDLLFNIVFAWEGAVAVAGPSERGMVGSHRFLTCVCDQERADPSFLWRFFQTEDGLSQLRAASPGGAGRNRTLSLGGLAQLQVPLPPLREQQRIALRLDDATRAISKRAEATASAEAEVNALLRSAFRRATAGAPQVRLGDVAPLMRRPVTVEPGTVYKEVGARAFGRGLFSKPPLRADDLTWQQPFWIESGDLVFSNIKAWEGAFAVAGPEHDGCVGSHRYLTCVPDATRATSGFLWFCLQSPAGMAAIQAASPGSADRNRTLSPKALAEIRVPLPSLDAQQAFDALQTKAAEVRASQRDAGEELGKLLPALLHEAFAEGAPHSLAA